MDERRLRAHEAVAAAQAVLYDALGLLIQGCKEQGMDRAATRAHAMKLRATVHSCTRTPCEPCQADDAAFELLWPEEGTND